MHKILKLLPVIITPFFFLVTSAQYRHYPGYINPKSFPDDLVLDSTQYDMAFTDSAVDISSISLLPYRNPSKQLNSPGLIEGNLNRKHIYIRFLLTNTSDSSQPLYFYPGYYFKSIYLFKKAADSSASATASLPGVIPGIKNGNAFRRIVVNPHETNVYYVQLQPVKIRKNRLSINLLHPGYLKTYVALMQGETVSPDIFNYMMVGVMCMMVLFALANYVLTAKKEFLYYCLYAALIAFVLFSKSYLNKSANDFIYFFEEYLDFLLFITGVLCYIVFIRYFLSTRTQYPSVDKVLKIIEFIYIGFIIIHAFIYLLGNDIVMIEQMEDLVKYTMLAGVLLFVVLGFRQHNRLVNYLVYGNLCMLVFGFISVAISVAQIPLHGIFTSSLFYYDLGMVTELGFFLLGLTYKGRQELVEKIKIEDDRNLLAEKKGFEKQLATIQAEHDERDRISADMHDELGGGMTAIRLMSELAKHRMNKANLPDLEKISESANDLLDKINVIIWSMSHNNDTLISLVAYIRAYAFEFFENHLLAYDIRIPDEIPEVEMSGIKRRNIFFSVKEILSNIVKHSKATHVQLGISVEDHLEIVIKDNGIGIAHDIPGGADSGLATIHKRMQLISGAFYVLNDNGTRAVLEAEF
ncbi:MAG TPA: 7TM diverse intracellular signaling domain-containing protein [Agriterribacter sp.]|nr:7TM diverse intracellular signaling domain-containing protein [Agriterribacter sp.]